MLLAFYENQLHHRNIYFVFGIDLSRSGFRGIIKTMKRRGSDTFFSCEICSFTASFASQLCRHNKTEKHIRNSSLVNLESTSHSTSYEHDEDAENVENTGNDHADDGAIHQVRLFTSTKHRIYSKICWKLHLYVKYYCP